MLRDGDVEAGKLPIAGASNPSLYIVEVIVLPRNSLCSLHSSGHNPKAHMQPDAFTAIVWPSVLLDDGRSNDFFFFFFDFLLIINIARGYIARNSFAWRLCLSKSTLRVSLLKFLRDSAYAVKTK